MGILRRLFSNDNSGFHSELENLTFIDCLNIVQTWSAQATIDPDLELDNKALNNALHATVNCPYCSNEIVFGDAVTSHGVRLTVRCPSCGTEPAAARSHYEFEIA